MANLIKPQDLKKISDDADMAKAKEYLEGAKREEAEQKRLRDAFIGRDIGPDVVERVNTAVRTMAEQGRSEIEILTFPAKFCKDGGRRINNNEPDWPESLDGFAKKAYDYYDRNLRPLGYKVRAQVIDYPDGMLGNVGLYLSW